MSDEQPLADCLADTLDRIDRQRPGWTYGDRYSSIRQRTTTRPRIPASIRHAVTIRDGRTCRFCDATDHLAFDHITPWSSGGRHASANLRILCSPCNAARSNRATPSDYRTVLGCTWLCQQCDPDDFTQQLHWAEHNAGPTPVLAFCAWCREISWAHPDDIDKDTRRLFEDATRRPRTSPHYRELQRALTG